MDFAAVPLFWSTEKLGGSSNGWSSPVGGQVTGASSPNMDRSGSSSGSDDKILLEGETCKLMQRQVRLLQLPEGGEFLPEGAGLCPPAARLTLAALIAVHFPNDGPICPYAGGYQLNLNHLRYTKSFYRKNTRVSKDLEKFSGFYWT